MDVAERSTGDGPSGIGPFRCTDCGEAGADFGEFTRTMSWEPSSKGW